MFSHPDPPPAPGLNERRSMLVKGVDARIFAPFWVRDRRSE
jgi:hypothetical protein